MLPAWHQRFSASGHVGESDIIIKKENETIHNFQVYFASTQLLYCVSQKEVDKTLTDDCRKTKIGSGTTCQQYISEIKDGILLINKANKENKCKANKENKM